MFQEHKAKGLLRRLPIQRQGWVNKIYKAHPLEEQSEAVTAPAGRHLVRRRPTLLTSGLFHIAAAFLSLSFESVASEIRKSALTSDGPNNSPYKTAGLQRQTDLKYAQLFVGIFKGSLPGIVSWSMQLLPSISPPFLWTPHLICPYPPAHKVTCRSLNSASLWGNASIHVTGALIGNPKATLQRCPHHAEAHAEVQKWSPPSSVPLLITWVPKQLCQHPGSHQVTPSTPRTPPPPCQAWATWRNLGPAGTSVSSKGSPTLSPQGLMPNPWS